jgi:hypothetical protein
MTEREEPQVDPAYEPPTVSDVPVDGPAAICAIVQQTPVA